MMNNYIALLNEFITDVDVDDITIHFNANSLLEVMDNGITDQKIVSVSASKVIGDFTQIKSQNIYVDEIYEFSAGHGINFNDPVIFSGDLSCTDLYVNNIFEYPGGTDINLEATNDLYLKSPNNTYLQTDSFSALTNSYVILANNTLTLNGINHLYLYGDAGITSSTFGTHSISANILDITTGAINITGDIVSSDDITCDTLNCNNFSATTLSTSNLAAIGPSISLTGDIASSSTITCSTLYATNIFVPTVYTLAIGPIGSSTYISIGADLISNDDITCNTLNCTNFSIPALTTGAINAISTDISISGNILSSDDITCDILNSNEVNTSELITNKITSTSSARWDINGVLDIFSTSIANIVGPTACQISSTNDIYLTSPNTKIGNNTYITDTTLTAPSILADDYNGLIINDTVFMNKSRVASYSQSSQSIPPTTDTAVFFDLPGPGPLVSYGIGRTITNFWKTRAPTAVWDIYYQIICQSFTPGYNARAHIQKIGSSIRYGRTSVQQNPTGFFTLTTTCKIVMQQWDEIRVLFWHDAPSNIDIGGNNTAWQVQIVITEI